MHINIKSDDAHRMAKELSRLTGESLTQAVKKAIEQRLERERKRSRISRESLEDVLQGLADEYQALPMRDPRSPDELLYDESGLPNRRR